MTEWCSFRSTRSQHPRANHPSAGFGVSACQRGSQWSPGSAVCMSDRPATGQIPHAVLAGMFLMKCVGQYLAKVTSPECCPIISPDQGQGAIQNEQPGIETMRVGRPVLMRLDLAVPEFIAVAAQSCLKLCLVHGQIPCT